MAKKPPYVFPEALVRVMRALEEECQRQIDLATARAKEQLARRMDLYIKIGKGEAGRDDLRMLNAITGVSLKDLIEANRVQKEVERGKGQKS